MSLDFDIQVRIDVVSAKVIVGMHVKVNDLTKERHFLRFRNTVTIKNNLTYTMIRCVNITNINFVVDMSRIFNHNFFMSSSLGASLTRRRF